MLVVEGIRSLLIMNFLGVVLIRVAIDRAAEVTADSNFVSFSRDCRSAFQFLPVHA